MNVGKLFEAALKRADIDLKPGTEFKVQVTSNGKHLRLVVAPPVLSEFERIVLERSKISIEEKAPYRPNLTVGETVRALRKAAGLTLDALAKRAGMSKGSLCSIEKGERSAGLLVLKKLAEALKVPLSSLAR